MRHVSLRFGNWTLLAAGSLAACSVHEHAITAESSEAGNGGTAASVGGSSSVGGTSARAGSSSTSGNTLAGGTQSMGGAGATGGNEASGGAVTPSGTGGTSATPTTGGTNATGGTVATGGVVATGGATGSGGTSSLGGTSATSTCGFKQPCSVLDYTCNDGTCITPLQRCDRTSNCTYGEDEIGCTLAPLSCYRCLQGNCNAQFTACLSDSTCVKEFIAMQLCTNARQQGNWPGQTSPEPYTSNAQVAVCASQVASQGIPLHTAALDVVNCSVDCDSKCFNSAVEDPELANPQGWFGGDSTSQADDPMGFQGSWYAFADGYSCPDVVANPNLNPCCGGKCCLKGTTFKDPQSLKWGCGIGFKFNATASATDTPRQYAGPAEGLMVDVTGNLGGLALRFQFAQIGPTTLKSPPVVEITSTGTYAIDFLSAAYLSWCTSSSCTGIPGDPVLAKPYGVDFEIVGGNAAAPYDFCIDSVRPYASQGAWTCDQSHYGTNDGCDCGCGIPDPDCTGAGCTQGSCRDSSCSHCYNSLGNMVACTSSGASGSTGVGGSGAGGSGAGGA